MSETLITESAPAEKRKRRVPLWSAVVTVLCLLMAGGGFMLTVLVSGVTEMDARLSRLETQGRGDTTAEALTTLQAQVAALETGLADNRQRVDVLQKETAALSQSREQAGTLAQQLQAQQTELTALKESLEAVKKSVAAPVTPAATPSAVPPATVPPASTSAPVKTTPRKATTPVTRSAPFVLTGVERRGAVAYAAVAPQGFRDLTQVRLLGEGESLSGWTLVSAGHGQATFRVNGRLQTVSVQ